MNIKPKIVTIGGGTGNFTLLSTLKNFTPNITALVNMTDDGGSTGKLRDQLGVLPPGDVRQCLVALSKSSQELRELFTYRFDEGTFAGHSFGNLFLSAVEKMTNGDFVKGIEMASHVLRITGRVLPVTTDNCRLAMDLSGQIVQGEYAIGHTVVSPAQKPRLWLEPHSSLNPDARKYIMESDVIVIAPGNLYGSLIPALLPEGLKDAIADSSAKVFYVCNLVNLSTLPGFAVHDYVCELERYIGSGSVKYVLHNTLAPPPQKLSYYAKEGEYLIEDTYVGPERSYQVISGEFLSTEIAEQAVGDEMQRNLIRHNAVVVCKAILSVA